MSDYEKYLLAIQLAETVAKVAGVHPPLADRLAELALEMLGEKAAAAKEPETFIIRLAAERDRTISDLGKLTSFLETEASLAIGAEANSDLHTQKEIMTQLAFILSKRYDDLTQGA